MQTNQNIILCVICSQPLHKPKTLPCMHTCCQECLREFIFSRMYDAIGQFPCPVCRQTVRLPPGGIASLPDRFSIVGLLDTLSMGNGDMGSFIPTGGTDLRFCFGCHGPAVTDLMEPVGLAIKSCGDVVVTDRHRNRILTFDVRGQVKGAFSCRHNINDIAVTDSDTVVVAGLGPALAIEYDTLTGTKLRSFGTFSLLDPVHGITVLNTPPFQVAVSSCETGTVYVLSDSGRLVRKFSRRSVNGKPFHMAASSRGDLIISDHANNRVSVVDRMTGNCKLQMGFLGNGSGCLYQPLGVTVDDEDNILVADSGNRRVVQFSKSGKYRGVVVDMSRSAGKPVNVAYMRGAGVLAILVTGLNYAQVRIYSYIPTKHGDVSAIGKLRRGLCSSSGQTV